MYEVRARLQPNLIGRLLGKDELCVQKDSLAKSRNGNVGASVSIAECRQFATLEDGIFGGVLTLKIDHAFIRYRFLKKKGADEFVNVLNRTIAEYVADYISRSFDEFHTHVIREYPRDSRLALLSMLCRKLSEQYSAQAELWEAYLSSECIRNPRCQNSCRVT